MSTKVETKTRVWWVATDWLNAGGRKLLGPFVHQDGAMRARDYIERLERHHRYFVDSQDAVGG